MKKLMFAASVVALCGAASAIDMTGEPLPIQDGVYTLTLTHKSLEDVTKVYTESCPRNGEEATEGLARSAARDRFDEIVDGIAEKDQEAARDVYMVNDEPTVEEVKSGAKKGYWTWKFQYVAPVLAKSQRPTPGHNYYKTSKIVSSTINGVYVVDQGVARTIMWNPQVKDTFHNTYAKADQTANESFTLASADDAKAMVESINETGLVRDDLLPAGKSLKSSGKVGTDLSDIVEGSAIASGKNVSWKYIQKFSSSTLVVGEEQDMFTMSALSRITEDGKSAAGFDWASYEAGSVTAWGTGTAAKDTVRGSPTENEYVSIKDVAGNTVGETYGIYGTWKFQQDATMTKQYQVEGKSISEILAKKGVELAE